MDWNKLKGIVGVNILNKLKSGKLTLSIVSVNIDNRKQENNLYLNPYELPKDQQVQLSQFIRQSIDNKSAGFIDQEDFGKLSAYKASQSQQSPILTYFKGKIPDLDLEILGYAIYSQKLFMDGDSSSASTIKQQVITQYGVRAKNIMNIYSAGYFDSTIKPLSEILTDKNGFNRELFLEIYEIIVVESILTFFVSSHISYEQAKLKLNERISINKNYGAYKINLHGINKENIQTIEKLVEDVKDQILDSPIIITDGRAILVKLRLKQEALNADLCSTRTRKLIEIAG